MIELSALERCRGVGTTQCHAFRERIFKRHMWLSGAIATEYLRLNRAAGYVAANRMLLDIEQALKLGGTGLYADMGDAEYIAYASVKSKNAEKDILECGRRLGSDAAIAMGEKICEAAGVEYPADIRCSDSPAMKARKHVAAMARLCCAKWWRYKIRCWAARQVEQVCRVLGMVHRKKSLYVSKFTLARRQDQKKRNNQLLLNLVAENEDGYSLTLAEAAEAGMANPENRRNELMVRMRGFEEVAKAIGCVGVFFTLTAPGQYHAVTAKGFKNAKFNGANPREVQEYLNGVWSRVRSEWHKKEIRVFGFRVVEPHHDATPHWHQLLFIRKEQQAEAVAIFRKHAIAVDVEELKNAIGVIDASPRFLAVEIDPAKGSAVGYMAKYISKNIDGAMMGVDFESLNKMTPAEQTAARVEAWASTWGIRQFQQLGSISVTVWREVRRAQKEIEGAVAEKGELGAAVFWAELSAACEAQDWARFVELMGGAFVARNDQTVRPLMILADKENNYGEEYKKIQGVIMRAVHRLITRVHVWTVTKKPVEAGGVFKARGWGRDVVGPPWVCWVGNRGENRPALDLCK